MKFESYTIDEQTGNVNKVYPFNFSTGDSTIDTYFSMISNYLPSYTELLDNNETFKEQTRRYDDKLGDTVLMRVKETGNDYRYFPEPDIPYLYVTDEMIREATKSLCMLPDERRKVYISKGVSEINANKLVQNRPLSDYFNTLLDEKTNFKIASNLLLGDISAYLNKNEKLITETTLTKERFISLISKIEDNTLTSKNLKEILDTVLEEETSIEDIIKNSGISNITDDSVIREIIKNIINNNKESVADYKAGHDRAIKFLMGQVMKETKGSANPKLAMDILQEELK